MNVKGDIPRLITAVAEGRTYSEIARVAGVSVSTVKRRLQDPEVIDAIRGARVQLHREHAGQMGRLVTESIAGLGLLVGNADPHVALRAISLVLGTHLKLTATVDFEERLAQLERSASEHECGDDDDS